MAEATARSSELQLIIHWSVILATPSASYVNMATIAEVAEQVGLSVGCCPRLKMPKQQSLETLAKSPVPWCLAFNTVPQLQHAGRWRTARQRSGWRCDGVRNAVTLIICWHMTKVQTSCLSRFKVLWTMPLKSFLLLSILGLSLSTCSQAKLSRHGQYTYLLEPGTLSPFRVMFPGPEKLIELPIRFLAIIHYSILKDCSKQYRHNHSR